MTSEMRMLTDYPAWTALTAHSAKIRGIHLRQLFADDPKRGERMTIEAVGVYLDYSKNRIADATLTLLLELASESGLAGRIEAMFRGDKINVSEERAVLHVAPRAPPSTTILVDGQDVMADPCRSRQDGGVRGSCPKRRLAGSHREADAQHREYWHRRLRPRPGHGV